MRGRAPSFPYNGQNGRTFQGRGCKDPTPLCFFFFAFFFFLPLSRLMQFSKHSEQPLGPMCTSHSASQEFLAPLRASAVRIVCSLLQKKKKRNLIYKTQLCVLLVPRGTESPRRALPHAVLTPGPRQRGLRHHPLKCRQETHSPMIMPGAQEGAA